MTDILRMSALCLPCKALMWAQAARMIRGGHLPDA